jgi:tetrahydromethanopterin S-methyltransferase subunit E
MNPRVSSGRVQTRNPIAQSLALAVLGLALVAAVIMGAVVFAVLLGIFAVGYLMSLAYAWWRLFRLRRRATFTDPVFVDPVFVDQGQPIPAKTDYIEGDYEVVEATAEAARRGSGGPA